MNLAAQKKKWLSVIGMVIAIIGVTYCSNSPTGTNSSPSTSQNVVVNSTLSTAPIISNIIVKSKNLYVAHTGGMAVGDTVYTDRKYVTLTVPSAVIGASWIQTPNNDKNTDLKDTAFLQFTVDRPVTVYVAHDNRATVPAWLTKWTATSTTITNTDLYGKQFLKVFQKSFAAGTVVLGSNNDNSQNSNMYMVMATSDSSITPPPSDTATTLSILPVNATDTVGKNVQFTGTLKDSSGKVLSGTIVWSSSNTGVATISSNGIVTGVAAGTDTIKATFNSLIAKTKLIVVAASTTTQHTGWYVAPNGSSTGAGTITSPWNLATAVSTTKIQPGDTVWLRGGTYGNGEADASSNYIITLNGTSSSPIIFRQYPGEHANLDGTIDVEGSYVWLWGFEISNTSSTTQNIQGVDSHCLGCRFINLVVHDHSGDGFGLWSEGPNQVAYGNLVYNNGFHGSTSTSYGHGIYSQNQTGTKLLENNILWNQFGYGVHIYGSGNAFLVNFTLKGNVSFNSGVKDGMNYTIGGGSPLVNLVATNNMAYYNPNRLPANSFRIGYNFGITNSNGVCTNNYIVGTAFVSQWTSNFTFTGNTVINNGTVVLVDQDVPTNSNWDNNSYVNLSQFDPFNVLGNAWTLSNWQSTYGYDLHSSLTTTLPPNHIVVEPNTYEAGRGNIIVYNWSHQGTVTVDLSTVLNIGDSFVIKNAQNFYGSPVYSGTYSGPISLPITAIAPPASITGTSVFSTSNEFQVFVVLKNGIE